MEHQISAPLITATGIAFDGEATMTMGFGSIQLAMPAIHNNRADGNFSGTLRIELWDTDAHYEGGDFAGEPLAGFTIGVLSAGFFFAPCNYELINLSLNNTAARPVVMLREWDGVAYQTVAFRHLGQPHVAPVSAPAAAPVAAPELKQQPETSDEKKASKSKKAARKKVAEAGVLDINEASLEEVAAIKGVSRKLAEAIVAGRPYTRANELLRVKGVGIKLLDKIKDSITF